MAPVLRLTIKMTVINIIRIRILKAKIEEELLHAMFKNFIEWFPNTTYAYGTGCNLQPQASQQTQFINMCLFLNVRLMMIKNCSKYIIGDFKK
jgi:hypothetical protein